MEKNQMEVKDVCYHLQEAAEKIKSCQTFIIDAQSNIKKAYTILKNERAEIGHKSSEIQEEIRKVQTAEENMNKLMIELKKVLADVPDVFAFTRRTIPGRLTDSGVIVSTDSASLFNDGTHSEDDSSKITTSQNESTTCAWNIPVNDLSKSSTTSDSVPRKEDRQVLSRLKPEREETTEASGGLEIPNVDETAEAWLLNNAGSWSQTPSSANNNTQSGSDSESQA